MDDLPVMLKIYQHARELMAANGNPTQWGNTFPREEVIVDDIQPVSAPMLLVDEADGKERVLAQFALCTGEDPTYAHIDGAWLDDDSYVTIHRIASSGIVKGAAKRLHQLVHRTLRQRARRHASEQQGHAARARIERIRPLRPDRTA